MSERQLGLLGATGVGVGAIVGGGILALSGVAFATTGPSAILAFAANGAVAALTVLSFARMSRAFPESGGTYTFAKKVLSVEAAFMVGWVVWFASIMAAVLYAKGFAAFAITGLRALAPADGALTGWLATRWAFAVFIAGAVAFYAATLLRGRGAARQWATVGKSVLFVGLIAAGAIALAGEPAARIDDQLSPFFAEGALGLIQAMGYTFIALQGFDLIAAVAGDVRDAERNVPRAMMLSLAAALALYLPLLFLIAAVGAPPGESITAVARREPETLVAVAVRNFLGAPGYWLVIVAGVLSMLSALQANLYASSRVARAMAGDHTLPFTLARESASTGAPVNAVLATAGLVAVFALLIPDVAAAGAASSLIFLVSFAIVHWASLLASRRLRGAAVARARGEAWLPAAGAIACLSLAVFQAFAVTEAGVVVAAWLFAGASIYFVFLAPRAAVVDASAEGLNPELVRLRGRSPLVLVPVANPASAARLVGIGASLVSPDVGRVLVLSVIGKDGPRDAKAVLGESLVASLAAGVPVEALTTVAADPWLEIRRVARLHRCEVLVLGLGRLDSPGLERQVEQVMGAVDADVVVVRTPPDFRPASAERILVPVGGRRDQSKLRARLLGSLSRSGPREIQFLRVVPEDASEDSLQRAAADLGRLARDEGGASSQILLVRSNDVLGELARHAQEADLTLLGLQRYGRRAKVFGELALRLARETSCPLVLISRRG